MQPSRQQLAQLMAQDQMQQGPVIQQQFYKVDPPKIDRGGGGGGISGMNPLAMKNALSGGSSPVGGTGAGASQLPGLQASGATTSGIGMGGTGTGAAAGPVVGTPLAGGGGAGGAAGGGLLAAWPAAIVAAAAVNEYNAQGTDRRADNAGEQIFDFGTGKVGLADTEYFGRKLFGQDNFLSNAMRKII